MGKRIPDIVGWIYALLIAIAASYFVLPGLMLLPKKKIKETIQEVAQKLNLEYKNLRGADGLIAPIFARVEAAGNYKNFHIEIKPRGSGAFPLFQPLLSLFLGYTEVAIEISPVSVSPQTPGIKKSFKALYFNLPRSLEEMPYRFTGNWILIEKDKLILETENKLPKSDEIIFMVEEMVKIAGGAAGSNLPSNNQIVQPENNPKIFIPKNKTNWKFLAIVIVLAVIVGGGVLGYWNKVRKEIITIYQQIPQIIKDETADWQTYENEEYGFELKYSTSTNISYEGKTEFALQPLKVDFGSFLITVWDNPGKLSIKDYFLQNSACNQNKPTCEYFSQGYPLESVEVGSRWGWTTEVGVKSQFFVYLFTVGKEYSIVEFLNRWSDNVGKTKVFNQMLSTFKFIEGTSIQTGKFDLNYDEIKRSLSQGSQPWRQDINRVFMAQGFDQKDINNKKEISRSVNNETDEIKYEISHGGQTYIVTTVSFAADGGMWFISEITDKSTNWENQSLEKIKAVIKKVLPSCFQKNASLVKIFDQRDVTGDGVLEAIVSNGCTGAYTIHLSLFQLIDGEPVLASFIDEKGKEMESEIFLTGASLMNYLKFGMLKDSQVVYQAHGSVVSSSECEATGVCKINWTIRPFRWQASVSAFQLETALAEEIKAKESQNFPPYADFRL